MQNEMTIANLVRENIRMLQPYSCARDEFNGENALLLDANENPYDNGYNRYPDPYQQKLKQKIAQLKKVPVENIVLGNGSDEIIDLLIRSFCEPGRDNLVVFSPGYSMYEVSAAINEVEVKKINLTLEFLPDWEEMYRQIDGYTKIIFLCTPNNPTGKVIPFGQIEQLCRNFSGLVVVDEAYVDFMEEASAVQLLEEYENVVVMQTLSKAWGMAGLRLGMCFADRQIVEVLNKVKAPYNIGCLTQTTVLELLDRQEELIRNCRLIKTERERLIPELRKLGIFEEVFDSEANFILATHQECRKLYRALVRENIVVRLRDIPPVIPGGIRITVGTPEENNRLLAALRKMDLMVSVF